MIPFKLCLQWRETKTTSGAGNEADASNVPDWKLITSAWKLWLLDSAKFRQFFEQFNTSLSFILAGSHLPPVLSTDDKMKRTALCSSWNFLLNTVMFSDPTKISSNSWGWCKSWSYMLTLKKNSIAILVSCIFDARMVVGASKSRLAV